MAFLPNNDELQRRALLMQMAPQVEPTNPLDAIGQTAADNAGTVSKLFGGKFTPSASTIGIGIGGEILGGLLKPKHDETKVGAFGDYLSQYRRRMEGSGDGVAGGAAKWGGRGATIGSFVPGVGNLAGLGIGAAAGAIGNLFTRNAKSAYTDFAVDDARKAIRDIYQREGGRDVADAELDQILRGQGWKPGDRFVGEKGMLSVMDNLRSNFRTERPQQAQAQEPARGGSDMGSIMSRANQIRNLDRNALIAMMNRRGV